MKTNLTFPRLLVAVLTINLMLSVTASPFYLGSSSVSKTAVAGEAQKPIGGVNPFFRFKPSEEMKAWEQAEQAERNNSAPVHQLTPPPPEPGDECEVTEICICPAVFCELGMFCYELWHNCGSGPKK